MVKWTDDELMIRCVDRGQMDRWVPGRCWTQNTEGNDSSSSERDLGGIGNPLLRTQLHPPPHETHSQAPPPSSHWSCPSPRPGVPTLSPSDFGTGSSLNGLS